jgi:hypothetical protein
MLDSRVNSNFIEQEFIRKHNIPLTKKTMKVPLQVIDGTLIALKGISHHTSPSELFLGAHIERISLDVILLSDYDVMLSILWLKEHNPKVNWAQQMLKLGKRLILTGAVTLDSARRKSVSPEILVAVPKEYYNFAFLFKASAADKLPEHKL